MEEQNIGSYPEWSSSSHSLQSIVTFIFKYFNKTLEGGAGQISKGQINPLLVPTIVEILMENLDDKSILKARTVCKLWNGEAIKSIRNKIQGNKFKSRLHVLNLSSKSSAVIAFHDKWQPVFEKSQVLDILFSKMIVTVEDAKDLWKFWNSSGIEQDALLKYCSFFKQMIMLPSLSLVNVDDGGNLVQLLCEVCPNLKKLSITDPILTTPITDENAFYFADNQTLKLQSLQYWIVNGHIEDSIDERNYQILKTLLNHSPRLTSIDLQLNITPVWNLFFNELSAKPEIALNLKEINLKGNILDVLHLLNNTKFGSNLTTVKLLHVVHRPHFPDDIWYQFQRFMRTIGINLEHLEFRQSMNKNRPDLDFEEPIWMVEEDQVNNIFPEMHRLKKFSTLTFFQFQSFKFLEKMPNLIELNVRITVKMLSQNCCPNNKIRKLNLAEPLSYDSWPRKRNFIFHHIRWSDTIKKFNLAFPNLTDFCLELIRPRILTHHAYGLQLWFQDICKEISLMQNLRRLHILLFRIPTLFPSDYENGCYIPWEWYSLFNLEGGFQFLKTTPKLESLILGHVLIYSNGVLELNGREREVPFPRAPLLKLLEAPCLTSLQLSGLTVNAVDAGDRKEIEEVTEFFKIFSESRVMLRIVKSNTLKWLSDD